MTDLPGELGPLLHKSRSFGFSEKGLPLEIIEPLDHHSNLLIMGSMHGDESLSTVLLSECLRSLVPDQIKSNIVLAANPDGVLNGTRCNSRGVDLNRNYPTQNWSPDPVHYRNRPDEAQNIALSPGESGGSESETRALIELIHQSKPRLVISIHGFLGCVDDPDASVIGQDIAERIDMELVPDVGYATPGSFGSWCREQNIPIITYELPSMAITELKQRHIPVLKDLIQGHYDHMIP